MNNTVNLVSKTAVLFSEILSHNSFLVLFDKIASIYFMEHGKWPAQGTSTVPIVSAHFRSLYAYKKR